MDRNKLIWLGAISLLAIGINFTGCTKSKNDVNTDTTTLQQLAKDQADVQSASEDGLNDANSVVSPGTSKSRWVPAHATLDSTFSGDTTIYTIIYNGNNSFGNRSRTGEIIIKRLTSISWSQAGDSLWISFINYKVTKAATGKSVTLNGTKAYVNVSGGWVGNGVTSVVHKITGTMQITFDDNTTRSWNIARQRTFTGPLGQIVLTTEGFGTASGYGNLEAWGTNRNGELFYTQINQGIVRKLYSCGLEPTSGITEHSIPSDNKSATITFGFDVNNQPVSASSSSCPVKYKLDWVKNGHSGTLYVLI